MRFNADKVKKQEKDIAEHKEMRLYYQHMLLKYVRDIKLFKDPVKLRRFNTINEYEDNMQTQKGFIKELQAIELQKEMIKHTNTELGTIEHIEYLNYALNELGFLSIDQEQSKDELNMLGQAIYTETTEMIITIA